MPLVLTRSDVSRERETRSQNYTRTYSFDDATTQKMRRIFAKGRFRKKASVSFCKETVQIQGASKNKAETYLLYVEHLFLRSNAVDGMHIFKRRG